MNIYSKFFRAFFVERNHIRPLCPSVRPSVAEVCRISVSPKNFTTEITKKLNEKNLTKNLKMAGNSEKPVEMAGNFEKHVKS